MYLPEDTDALVCADIITEFKYGDSMNDNDKDIQCDLITEDGGHQFDPTLLSYKLA